MGASGFAVAHIERLEEQRLTAVETRIDADLAEGRHAELVGELRERTGDHPWREHLYAQLMLALYRLGTHVPDHLAWSYPTIALISEQLASAESLA